MYFEECIFECVQPTPVGSVLGDFVASIHRQLRTILDTEGAEVDGAKRLPATIDPSVTNQVCESLRMGSGHATMLRLWSGHLTALLESLTKYCFPSSVPQQTSLQP